MILYKEDPELVPVWWNAFRKGDSFELRGKWINFLSENGWDGIDPRILSDRSANKLPYSIQIPETAQGNVSISVNSRFSIRRYIEEKNGDNSEPDFEITMRCLTDNNVTGHQDPEDPTSRIYPNAWTGTVLRYGIEHRKTPRVVKTLEIDPNTVQSNQSLNYSFEIRSPNMKTFRGGVGGTEWLRDSSSPGLNIRNDTLYLGLGNSRIRGMTIKSPICWWFESGVRKTQAVQVSMLAMSDGETIRLTKHIPKSVISDAKKAGSILYTDAVLYPDADPESTTVDGDVGVTVASDTWSNLKGSNGTDVQDSTSLKAVKWATADIIDDQWADMARAAFLFDASAVTGTIASANFEISTTAGVNGLNLFYNVYESNPASNTELVITDFERGWGSTEFCANPRTAGELATGDTSFEMNIYGRAHISNALSGNGIVKYAIRSENDSDGVSPTWVDSDYDETTINFAEATGTGNDPKLTIIMGSVPVYVDRSKNAKFLVNFARF